MFWQTFFPLTIISHPPPPTPFPMQGSEPFLAPLYSVADFNCSNVNLSVVRWEVKFDSIQTPFRTPGSDEAALALKGVTSSAIMDGTAVQYSVLHVNATAQNNGTTVKCFRLSTSPMLIFAATLMVYGECWAPPPHACAHA